MRCISRLCICLKTIRIALLFPYLVKLPTSPVSPQSEISASRFLLHPQKVVSKIKVIIFEKDNSIFSSLSLTATLRGEITNFLLLKGSHKIGVHAFAWFYPTPLQQTEAWTPPPRHAESILTCLAVFYSVAMSKKTFFLVSIKSFIFSWNFWHYL